MLPVVSPWAMVILGDEEEIWYRKRDLRGCFHAFRTPSAWRPYTVLGKQVNVNMDSGLPPRWVWISMRVVPMGWCSAVGVELGGDDRAGGAVDSGSLDALAEAIAAAEGGRGAAALRKRLDGLHDSLAARGEDGGSGAGAPASKKRATAVAGGDAASRRTARALVSGCKEEAEVALMTCERLAVAWELKPSVVADVLVLNLGAVPASQLAGLRNALRFGLEWLAFWLAHRWCARQSARRNCRCLTLIDSAVVLSVAAKGRSSSHRLNRLWRRLRATCLAAFLYLCYVQVRSGDHPADSIDAILAQPKLHRHQCALCEARNQWLYLCGAGGGTALACGRLVCGDCIADVPGRPGVQRCKQCLRQGTNR